MIVVLIIIGILIAGLVCVFLYRKRKNKKADESCCPACRRIFRASDIVSENLMGDGLERGKMRKIAVTMQCSFCGERKIVTIYTEYRHHPAKGSPAHQYFKDVEARRVQTEQIDK